MLLLPLMGILFIYYGTFLKSKTIHNITLILSSIIFLLSMALWANYDSTTSLFSYTVSIFLIPSLNFNILLGIDGISIYFILLTNLFIYICILSLSSYQMRLRENLIHLLFLQWGVLSSFSVLDLLGFYIFFEATLIPIFFYCINLGISWT